MRKLAGWSAILATLCPSGSHSKPENQYVPDKDNEHESNCFRLCLAANLDVVQSHREFIHKKLLKIF